MKSVFFPAEWYPQSGVQVTWPHSDSDWCDMLEEVTCCYVVFCKEIIKREKLIVVCRNKDDVVSRFTVEEQKNIIVAEVESNDTWTRDHGGISTFENGQPVLNDFGFNAWGLKFAANHDNLITSRLYDSKRVFSPKVVYKNQLDFILEGGAIETDGKGTLLTTAQCLLSPNRNSSMDKRHIEDRLIEYFGCERILWLYRGHLAGDDTDSHIDTLARFCDERTIAYVRCDDENDEHYAELLAMEEELKRFVSYDGEPYRLISLPMADAVYEDGRRLPATYANFLIINGAVLLPFYGSQKDEKAKEKLQKAFPDREIVGIDCLPLIKQNGSLHCVTMQFPQGFL